MGYSCWSLSPPSRCWGCSTLSVLSSASGQGSATLRRTPAKSSVLGHKQENILSTAAQGTSADTGQPSGEHLRAEGMPCTKSQGMLPRATGTKHSCSSSTYRCLVQIQAVQVRSSRGRQFRAAPMLATDVRACLYSAAEHDGGANPLR